MPRIIFKCPYLKGGTKSASHLNNYVRYMATREGAQHLSPDLTQCPATPSQKQLVERLLQDFPLSRGLFEYEDYVAAPTQGNASEFITRALEDNADQIAKRENYVDYIASRPRAQRRGNHALFTDTDAPLVLSQIAGAVAHHPGNIWLPIISLRREDAARLGYDDAAQWRELLTGFAPEMAEAMKIPVEQFRWYAAFHDEATTLICTWSASARMESPAISTRMALRRSRQVWQKRSSVRNSMSYMVSRRYAGMHSHRTPENSCGRSQNRCKTALWRIPGSNSSWYTCLSS